MRFKISYLVVLLLLCAAGVAYAKTSSIEPGKVTMIDLGAASCTPCKMMAPILEKLKVEYAGRADVIFIDVKINRDEIDKYGINAIPTQLFYNKDGQEMSRHKGFLDEDSIRRILDNLLQS